MSFGGDYNSPSFPTVSNDSYIFNQDLATETNDLSFVVEYSKTPK